MNINNYTEKTYVNIDYTFKKKLIPKKIHYCWFGKKEIPDYVTIHSIQLFYGIKLLNNFVKRKTSYYNYTSIVITF